MYHPRGMEGCVNLGYPTMHRPGVEKATYRSQVRRPNHYTIEPPVVGHWFAVTLYSLHLPQSGKPIDTETVPLTEHFVPRTLRAQTHARDTLYTHCQTVLDTSVIGTLRTMTAIIG